MPFLLSRGARNVPTEVQRWQYFLLKQGITEVGGIDADFGLNTEKATSLFQTKVGLPKTGKLDSATLDVAKGWCGRWYDPWTGAWLGDVTFRSRVEVPAFSRDIALLAHHRCD